MLKNILTICLIVSSFAVCANDIKGSVKESNGTPLIGVNIFWKNTTLGEVTDVNGNFSIATTNESSTLVARYLGYKDAEIEVSKTTSDVNITLTPDKETLGEVEVAGRAPGAHISRIDPINSTKITGDELCKAACCNLAESFVTNPSVDVSYSDAATGAKQIRLLGLSGLYVQMMTENMPSFRGLGSIYGLEYIPGPWMESIQVSKGTASVINGYEAITGQINVEYKKPQSSEQFFINAFANNTGRKELNINGAIDINDKWSTMLLGHIKSDDMLVDNNGDNFLDMPMVTQYNFINRWSYDTDKYVAQYSAKVINETRESGQKSYYEKSDSAYGIDIQTERYEFFTKQGFIFDKSTGKSIGIQASGTYHHQNSMFGNFDFDPEKTTLYDATQKSAYLNVIYQDIINGNDSHSYSVGASLMYDDIEEKLDTRYTDNSANFNRTEIVGGAFGQYTYNLNDKFIALAGVRGDYHNEYDFFVTPRLHLKYNVTENIHLRANVGLGYRSANVLAENSYLLASSREVIIADNLDQEKALNTGFNTTIYIPIAGKEATWSTDYYYTNFYQQVITDIDSDPHKVSFYNLDGKSYSHALQTQISYEILRGLEVTAAYRYSDVKMTVNGELREKALTNKYKGLLTASYQTPLKKWQIDFTTQFNGGGRLPDGPDWENTYDGYTLLNAQVTKYFRKWSVYIGSENLTNFKMDNPIVDASNPWGNNYDASMVWGPVHGITVYGGIRFAIDNE